MALIKCPECGKMFSEFAISCPECGCPIEIIKRKQPKVEGHIYTKINGLEYDVTKVVKLLLIYYKKDDLNCNEKKEAYEIIRKEFHITPHNFEKAFDEKTMTVAEINCDPIRKSTKTTQQSSSQVTCPYCKSTNTKKISTVSRAGSIGLFGIFSKKVGKQWHCNNCGSDF